MEIRRAQSKDIAAVKKLLEQVMNVHVKLRPDIFVSGTVKYNEEELKRIFSDDNTPVYVAQDENGTVVGHLFAEYQESRAGAGLPTHKTFYIDDICVDENYRGKGVASSLYAFAKQTAKQNGCYNITLNVWEGNDGAECFYKKMGMFTRKTQMEEIL